MIPVILDGLGIKVKTKKPLMNKENFFFIYCVMKFGKGSKEDLQRMWLKLLDPENMVEVVQGTVINTIEKLARGKINCHPTLVSATFAFEIWEYLAEKGCLTKTGMLNMKTVREKMVKGEIDLFVLN